MHRDTASVIELSNRETVVALFRCSFLRWNILAAVRSHDPEV